MIVIVKKNSRLTRCMRSIMHNQIASLVFQALATHCMAHVRTRLIHVAVNSEAVFEHSHNDQVKHLLSEFPVPFLCLYTATDVQDTCTSNVAQACN
jgi:hypothetical protein